MLDLILSEIQAKHVITKDVFGARAAIVFCNKFVGFVIICKTQFLRGFLFLVVKFAMT